MLQEVDIDEVSNFFNTLFKINYHINW